jgi:hypothetical protein
MIPKYNRRRQQASFEVLLIPPMPAMCVLAGYGLCRRAGGKLPTVTHDA